MVTKATESKAVQKARKKLEKMLSEEQAHFNQDTLKEVRNAIHKWLARHEPERVTITDKTFTPFDENQLPSTTRSDYIQQLLQNIKAEAESEAVERRRLLPGRVTLKHFD